VETLSECGRYEQPWSRQQRGLIVLLLDQSMSMQEQALEIQGVSYTLGELATAALNGLIAAVVQMAKYDAETGRRKDYCDFLVFGYGDRIRPLLNAVGTPVALPDLAAKPRGQGLVMVETDGQGTSVETEEPFWFDYSATGDRTETALALAHACHAVEQWISARPGRNEKSSPPIVVNITDGRHNGEGDPVAQAKSLRRLGTADGNVLLFNCHVTSFDRPRVSFLSSIAQIHALNLPEEERAAAEQLFEMSSVIPGPIVTRAREEFGITLNQGARGFMYNADIKDFVRFLYWGTIPEMV
jgi:hypothetical protein